LKAACSFTALKWSGANNNDRKQSNQTKKQSKINDDNKDEHKTKYFIQTL